MDSLRVQTLTPTECYHLSRDSKCYAIHQYIIGEGFAGTVNQYVVNFKRSMSLRRQNETYAYYFHKAINAVSTDLSRILGRPELSPHIQRIVVLPSSKRRDHPDFNDKGDRIAERLRNLINVPVSSDLIDICESHDRVSHGGDRSIEFHRSNYYVVPERQGLIEQAEALVVVDDLITSGSHFQAAKALLLEVNPNLSVIGLFWARAVDRNG